MPMMTRRAAIVLGGTAVAAVTAFAFHRMGEDEISPAEHDAMARVAAGFMTRFDVPGLSVAIARHGRLLYQEPFGVANRDTSQLVSVSDIFRIASISKTLTSVAIFALVQQGKIRTEDRVFGRDGILGERYGTPPYHSFVQGITIDHLLTHTCGGWQNMKGDPMFMDPAINRDALISWTIDNRPLDYAPGTHWAYSNFGFCLLGRVIERVTGRSYSEYVKSEILTPCGVTDMQISGNTLEQRAPNEVIYYGQDGENPYGMNVERMDSHGGWLASASDLVRLAMHVDGFDTGSNILTANTIKEMTTPCGANENYARGWNVNRRGNWWHNGSMPGTSTIMVRTASGFCWAALANTRQFPSDVIDRELDDMVWAMVRQVRDWRSV